MVIYFSYKHQIFGKSDDKRCFINSKKQPLKKQSTDMMTLHEKDKDIETIIDVPSSLWQVVDTSEEHSLYLIDHKGSRRSAKVGEIKGSFDNENLRGLLVDKEQGVIVHRGLPTNIEVKVSDISNEKYADDVSTNNGDFAMIGNSLVISPNINYKLDIGFEGVTITTFLHKGKAFASPPVKLHADNSWWGSSPTFKEIMNQLDFPPLTSIFDSNKEYSPYIHRFILVHPSLLNVSKCPFYWSKSDKESEAAVARVKKGFIVYVGYEKRDLKGIDESLIDTELWQPPVNTDLDAIINFNDDGSKRPMYWCEKGIGIDVANKFLKEGFYTDAERHEDERLGLGEFVLMSVYSDHDNNTPLRVYRIHSPAYDWRLSMMKDLKGVDNPYLNHQFHQLVHNKNYILTEQYTMSNYLERFPWLIESQETTDALIETIKKDSFSGLLKWGDMICTHIEHPSAYTVRQRILNIAICFVLALPLTHQKEGLEAYNNYLSNKESITNSLCLSVYDQALNDALSQKMKKLIDYAIVLCRKELVISPYSKLPNNHRAISLLRRNVTMLIDKEGGPSLYYEMKWRQQQKG